MAVKLTKNELKVQKDRLKQFQRYLPTLQLKKQQLQSVVMQVTAQLEKVEAERLTFEEISYDVADYPLWVDTAVVTLREIARLDALVKTLRTQVELLERELRSTAQRVNLFEKVKIPEARENIRVIGIYLGDQQTSAVVRGKIAKKKLQEAAR